MTHQSPSTRIRTALEHRVSRPLSLPLRPSARPDGADRQLVAHHRRSIGHEHASRAGRQNVAWDILTFLATMLLAIVLGSHPRFRKSWGVVGFISGLLLLVFNLRTPPEARPKRARSIWELLSLCGCWLCSFECRWTSEAVQPRAESVWRSSTDLSPRAIPAGWR